MYTGPLRFAAGYLEDAAESLTKYVLVYVISLTGEGFWLSARRARALVTGAESGVRQFLCSGAPPIPSPLTFITATPPLRSRQIRAPYSLSPV